MVSDTKLLWILLFVIAIPVTLAVFAEDRFRYPCQNPANWEKDMCKKPICEVTRTCPENIFKTKRPVENITPAQCNTCQPAGAKNAK